MITIVIFYTIIIMINMQTFSCNNLKYLIEVFYYMCYHLFGDEMIDRESRYKKTMSHFINVTDELINEIGIRNITIRKVAEKAGYNSATIYNYFENLDHLIFFASYRNLKDYILNLEKYLQDAKNAMDTFLIVWDCFCDHAYYKPEIFNAIFLVDLDKEADHYIVDYYTLFPEEAGAYGDTITNMIWTANLIQRGMKLAQDCVKEGYIAPGDDVKLNDMTMLIFEAMLQRVLKNKVSYEDARNITMEYYRTIVKSFLIKDYDFGKI